MPNRLLLLFIGILLHTYCLAQLKCDDDILRKAYLQARNNNYLGAIKTLNNSLEKHPNCAATFANLAELYYRTLQPDKANASLLQCYRLDTFKGMNALVELHQTMLNYNEDSLAINLLQSMLLLPLNTKDRNYCLNKIQLLTNKTIALAQPNTTERQLIDIAFNSLNYATSPSIGAFNNTLYFVSNTNQLDENFFTAAYDTCTKRWASPQIMPYPPNTSAPERSVFISYDQKYLFFTRCDSHSENGWDGGGCDVYFCYQEQDTNWSSPQKFGATINSPASELQPCLDAENNTLYFVSERKGGYGGKDIWVSKYDGSLWTEPVNAGKQINTSGNEEAPFLHADGKSFYFVSDKHSTIGGKDIFMAKRINDTIYTNPINAGANVNSVGNELAITVSASGKVAYIAAQSEVNKRKTQLYKADLLPNVQASSTILLQGKVFDKLEKSRLKGLFIGVYDSVGNLVKRFLSNEGDGSYSEVLANNKKYIIKSIDLDGYKSTIDTLDLTNNKQSIVTHNIPMKIIDGLDTLYNYIGKTHCTTDTFLSTIARQLATWKKNISDSIQLFFNVYENNFIDTSMANEVCFSETGYAHWLCYLDSIQQVKKYEYNRYVQWMLAYFKKIGIPDNCISTTFNTDAWRDERLLHIELSVVEYY
jgi:tetratricopeptide (TPR) repeat protein